MADYVLRKHLLDNGKYLTFVKNYKLMYRINSFETNGVLTSTIRNIIRNGNYDIVRDSSFKINQELSSSTDYLEMVNMFDSARKRTFRLSDRISKYLTIGQCIFLTLTFTDKVLESTTKETRRKYVRRFLKSQSDYYVANIDYGKKNGREHYHAVILADKIDYSEWNKHFGNINGEKIKNVANSPLKLGKYISKLTNHAIKESTKREVYIYSRN